MSYMEPHNELTERASRAALETLLTTATVLLCAVVALAIAGALGGCGIQQIVTETEVEGGARSAWLAFEDEDGDVYRCPVVTVDLRMAPAGVTIDVYAYGVPEDSAEVGIDPRCYEVPGPFGLRSRPPEATTGAGAGSETPSTL